MTCKSARLHRKEIWNSVIVPIMKPSSDAATKADNVPDKKTEDDSPGIDAIKILQIVAGIICAIIVIWLIFHSILHVF
ncbi:MAG: hypothetical protein WCX22_09525 [Methanoregula sp.]